MPIMLNIIIRITKVILIKIVIRTIIPILLILAITIAQILKTLETFLYYNKHKGNIKAIINEMKKIIK